MINIRILHYNNPKQYVLLFVSHSDDFIYHNVDRLLEWTDSGEAFQILRALTKINESRSSCLIFARQADAVVSIEQVATILQLHR